MVDIAGTIVRQIIVNKAPSPREGVRVMPAKASWRHGSWGSRGMDNGPGPRAEKVVNTTLTRPAVSPSHT